MRLEKREAQAEHAGLLRPAVDQRAALRPLHREVAEDREAIGVQVSRLDGQSVGVGIPRGGRMDDGCVHARFPHLVQQLVPGEGRDLPVAEVRRLAAGPDVHLRVHDGHGSIPQPPRRLRRTPSATRRPTGNPASFISNSGAWCGTLRLCVGAIPTRK